MFEKISNKLICFAFGENIVRFCFELDEVTAALTRHWCWHSDWMVLFSRTKELSGIKHHELLMEQVV